MTDLPLWIATVDGEPRWIIPSHDRVGALRIGACVLLAAGQMPREMTGHDRDLDDLVLALWLTVAGVSIVRPDENPLDRLTEQERDSLDARRSEPEEREVWNRWRPALRDKWAIIPWALPVRIGMDPDELPESPNLPRGWNKKRKGDA